MSSNEAFHLPELPRRIFIQGGGYIALEFAGIFNGLGSEVTLVYRGDNILRGFDDDVREHLRSEMERRGIKIITRQTVDLVAKVEHGYCVELADHKTFTVDRVMFATGRRGSVRSAWRTSKPMESTKLMTLMRGPPPALIEIATPGATSAPKVGSR